jgi:L-aspartate semialdehyde sulfurtransferase
LGQVTYEQLRSGEIEVNGQKVRTAPVASLAKARKIAEILKKQIQDGQFQLQEPIQMFPSNTSLKSLIEVEVKDTEGGEL